MPTHVLLVDDDKELRVTVRRMLEKLGCRVTEAEDGGEALAMHRADPVDVLVTDIVMDGKEGLETIRIFRRDFPTVRVVAISGGGVGPAGTYLRMAEHMGAHDALAKPFTMEQLEAAIGTADSR